MPKEKDQTGAELKGFADSVSKKISALTAIRSDNEKLRKAQQGLQKLGGILYRFAYDMKGLEPEASARFRTALKEYGNTMSDYVSHAGNHFSELSADERDFYHKAVDLAGLLRNNDDKLKSIHDTLQFTSRFKANFAGAGKQEAEAQFRRTGPVGHRPTPEECLNLSVNTGDPETVFDRMLWLQNQQFMLSGSEPAAGGFYHDALNRLQEELEAAPPQTQSLYAAMFQRHDVQLKEQANRVYEQALQMAPGEQSQAHREDYALQQLSRNTAFLQVKAFASFRDSFRNTRMGDTLDHIAAGPGGNLLAVSAAYPGQQLITGLIAGDMEGYLKGKNLFTQVEEANKTAMQQAARASGVRKSSTMSRIGDLYQRLSTDQGRASPSFRAMRDAMAEVAAMDHENVDRRGDYIAALTKARNMAQYYLDSHHGHRYTDSGRNRVAMAREMKALMDRQANRQMELQQKEDREKANAIAKSLKEKSTPEALREIAILNRHIAPVRIVPKEPGFSPEVTKANELKGEIKHQLFTISHGIFMGFNYLGGVYAEHKSPIHAKRPGTELNLDRIPGRSGEQFAKYDPDNPKNGGANQRILTDVRRPPLVWEQPIPENPNQPPTITFEFDQGREGDSTGYPVILKDGKKENEMGHGFLTLQYTKNNPFSGKPERYKVSFGFYPKGGFQGAEIMGAQVMKGMSVPGQLNEDNSHEVSTGLTYTVTNQQINRVLLAAQQYEKDGYNYFDRNCTTFVKDMSKVAGIDLSGVLKEVDLTSEGQTGKYALLNTVGTSASFHWAKRQALGKSGKTDESYQRFGQKMLNEEDVVRIEQSEKVFNKRMKGYAPGHASESARVAKGFKLHSSKYDREIHIALRPGEKAESPENQLFAGQTKLRLEFGSLCTAIFHRGEQDGLKPGELEPAINHMMEYTENMLQALNGYAQKGLIGKDPDKPAMNAEYSWQERRQALVDGTSAINEMIAGYDEIYRNTFRSDPELNIPFQHMVSLLEGFKETFAQKYRSMDDELSFVAGEPNDPETMKNIDSQLDLQRDTFQALRTFAFGTFRMQKDNDVPFTYPLPRAAALIQMFGSLQKGDEFFARRDELRAKENAGELSPEETKELASIGRRTEQINTFIDAQKSYFEDREFSVGDYSLAFIELPQGMKGMQVLDPKTAPDAVYQAMAMEKIFGGTKKALNNALNQATADIEKIKQINTRKRKNILVTDSNIRKKKREIKNAVYRHFSDSMKANRAELAKFSLVSLEKAKLDLPIAPGQTKEAYKKALADRAETFMLNKIVQNYLEPLEEDIRSNLTTEQSKLMPEEKLLKATDIRNMPEFHSLQRTIDEKLGIQRETPEETQRWMQEEARRQEEDRKLDEQIRKEEAGEENKEERPAESSGRKAPKKKGKKFTEISIGKFG